MSELPNNPQEDQPVAESATRQNERSGVLDGAVQAADPKDDDDVLTRRLPDKKDADTQAADRAVLASSASHTRRAFLIGSAAAASGYGFYRWLNHGPQRDMVPWLLDRTYGVNADVSQAVFDDRALAPTYALNKARPLRVNGVYGLKRELALSSYRMQVVGMRNAENDPRFVSDVTEWQYRYVGENAGDAGHDTKVDPNEKTSLKMAPEAMMARAEEDEDETGRRARGLEEAGESYSTLRPGTPGLLLTMDDIVPKLPRHEFVTQFKCIEGWSQFVHWAGVRMADFMELYPPALINGTEPQYVYMETPDGDYYVGYDLHVCRHPQTLLVTEMMGAPLEQFHGAPVRIHMPTKYGYKQIKRIGLIAYTNQKPDDYWTKLGYDWYGGL